MASPQTFNGLGIPFIPDTRALDSHIEALCELTKSNGNCINIGCGDCIFGVVDLDIFKQYQAHLKVTS